MAFLRRKRHAVMLVFCTLVVSQYCKMRSRQRLSCFWRVSSLGCTLQAAVQHQSVTHAHMRTNVDSGKLECGCNIFMRCKSYVKYGGNEKNSGNWNVLMGRRSHLLLADQGGPDHP